MSVLTQKVSATHWRLGAVLLVELVLLFYVPETGKWSSLHQEVYQYLGVGIISGVCIVTLGRVIRHGTVAERLAAGVLALFPVFLLIVIAGAIVRLWS